ncbi:MAG: GTP-binding protein [Actinobacteria bacterium]|nr:GTP-binding protein [Actinomycetota bacterium]
MSGNTSELESPIRPLLLVGNPNVGKSVLFGLLSGKYAMVSNYPGTTVEMSRSHVRLEGQKYDLIDTPGANSLLPNSEDEQVTARMVLENPEAIVLQVADAKNIARALMLTVQLAELEMPMVLALNMWDEAKDLHLSIDYLGLAERLGVRVVRTVATEKRGFTAVKHALGKAGIARMAVTYPEAIEQAVSRIQAKLGTNGRGSRGRALMILGGASGPLESLNAEDRQDILEIRRKTQIQFGEPLGYIISQTRFNYLGQLLEPIVGRPEVEQAGGSATRLAKTRILLAIITFLVGYKLADMVLGITPLQNRLGSLGYYLLLAGPGLLCSWAYQRFIRNPYFRQANSFSELLGLLTMRVRTAAPLVIITLWLLYLLVGKFAAGICVDFLENTVFGAYINPGLMYVVKLGVSEQSLVYKILFDPEAGLISVGLTYSVAIVLPIVGFFFLAFGLLEDSGYFPRLAMMLDKVFKRMGLSGKAALPMVLGLGCATMATLTTRVLETKKQRTIAILLLALAVPCSAQLGVIAGVLGRVSGGAFVLYVAVIGTQLLLVGYLAAKILPGPAPQLILEIPPFRVPQLGNVLTKTGYRLVWFLKEAVPLFLLGTLILFVLMRLGILAQLEQAAAPVVSGMLGLPEDTAKGFLMGFLRRDYAVVSIFNTYRQQAMGQDQILVALVVITLFVPCIANFFVMIKEKGIKIAFLMLAFIVPFAVLVGTALRGVLILYRSIFTGVN